MNISDRHHPMLTLADLCDLTICMHLTLICSYPLRFTYSIGSRIRIHFNRLETYRHISAIGIQI